MKPSFWASAALLGFTVALLSIPLPEGRALAQVYTGPGLTSGTNAGISGIASGSLRETIGNIVNNILSYVSLLAVVVIIIAGLYLILGLGNDSAKDTARKIVLYTAIGLLLILLSKALVMFFINLPSGTA